MSDKGSHSQFARILIEGVPADGIVDTGADITIMGKDLFAQVAAVAWLRKKDFWKVDKIPRAYDNKTFQLDGCMDLDISFAEKTLKTTVYLKMDAHDQLGSLSSVGYYILSSPDLSQADTEEEW